MAFAHRNQFHHQFNSPNQLKPKQIQTHQQQSPVFIHEPTNLSKQLNLLSQPIKMSLRLLTTRVAGPALRTSPSARLFTTTAPFKKSATETAQETIQKANKTAGEAGVAAIEKGRTSFPSFPPYTPSTPLHSPIPTLFLLPSCRPRP